MFTPRQKRMIKYLTYQQDYTPIRTLSKRFNVSERTIQYDLEHIEDALQTLRAEIIRNKKKGVKIDTNEDLLSLISDVSEEFKPFYSAEERFEQILLILFESLSPVSSNDFSNTLNVSRRTIVEDIKAVQRWLAQKALELEYVKNKGFKVTGDEKNFREAYVEIISRHYQNHETPLHLKFAGTHAVAKIYEVIEVALNKSNHTLMQSSLDGLVFHLAISLHRLRNDYRIEMPASELEKLKNKKEFRIALCIQQEMESAFDIIFPDSEAGYITLHLLGARQSLNDHRDGFEDEKLLKESIIEFLRNITLQMEMKVDHDQELIEGLMVHLKPAIYRFKYGFRNDNPLLEEINRRYPDIVYAVKANLHIIEKMFSVQFNDDEIAFITIHVGASLERRIKKREKKLRVLLICGSGIGTSQLLRTRIESYYPELDIVEVRSYTSLDNNYLNEKDIDYIISTIYLEKFQVPALHVSPFLNAEDRSNLNQVVNEQREKMVTQTIKLGPKINQLLSPDYIKWEASAKNWQEAIRITVDLLAADGLVEKEYSLEIIEQFNIHGPYMVIGKNIALIHASSMNHVNRTGYSFVKLKDPINFAHSRYDPVIYVICLATTSSKIHLNALRQLSFVLMDQTYMERVKNEGREGLIKCLDEVSQL
ncbi:BglG family transcription antiterminator [Salinicoccus albus]|uniref:BglG family transcription antiterminator n=1 Tax=Salinicoccus albus TaxID=418756 RepID=UPI00039A0620|nr:BglG family transcription antiterminator [Salinicoccus albus]